MSGNLEQIIYDDLDDKLFILRTCLITGTYHIEDENGEYEISRYHMIECFYETEWFIIEEILDGHLQW